MAKATNYKYEIKPNIREYMDNDFFYKKSRNPRLKWSDYYEEVGALCGVSPSTISQIRLKELTPSLIVAIKLSEMLHVPINVLCKVTEKAESEVVEECKVQGCDRVATTRGYCMKHLNRAYKELESEREELH